MSRVNKAVPARARHKTILKRAKGYRGARSRTFRVAKQSVMRAEQYAYRDRKQRKRVFRRLWIVRLNAACRRHGVSYSRFIPALKQANIHLDRKALAQMAVEDRAAFDSLLKQVMTSSA